MEKQIPIYFDNVSITAPAALISAQNQKLARLKVAAFTKYGNRNGSYITDEVATMLINSATTGNTPVVGFFDPASEKWAGHTGPKLANGYGYVESFLGWEPLQDTDGVTRDYAIFSVVLFTDYFTEAQKVAGQNQSMELNPELVDGTWAEIDGIEYFVYSKAQMLGFCIIGDHEPCFSVSTFFSKNDNTYQSQMDKFSSLLSDLKAQVEEAEKGGEQPMNELENKETVVEETVAFQAPDEAVEPAAEETPIVEETAPETTADFEAEVEPAQVEEEPEVFEEAPTAEETAPAVEDTPAEDWQAQFETLQSQYSQLQEQFNALQNNFNALQEQNAQLTAQVTDYQAQVTAAETERKNNLIDSYQNMVEPEEITVLRETVNDFSYDELESKLAVSFAHKQIAANSETNKVPLPEQEESSFARLMKKYRKN